MTHVDYNKENMFKCKCAVCPVQKNSSCAKVEKEEIVPQDGDEDMVDEELRIQDPGSLMPDPELTPGTYCTDAVDGASCSDLDFEQTCICGECDVWKENNLNCYKYCRNGSAEKNG